jgi:hypothetical protein
MESGRLEPPFYIKRTPLVERPFAFPTGYWLKKQQYILPATGFYNECLSRKIISDSFLGFWKSNHICRKDFNTLT